MTADIVELAVFCCGCLGLCLGLGFGLIFWWVVLK